LQISALSASNLDLRIGLNPVEIGPKVGLTLTNPSPNSTVLKGFNVEFDCKLHFDSTKIPLSTIIKKNGLQSYFALWGIGGHHELPLLH
jgi:hypothetical protein